MPVTVTTLVWLLGKSPDTVRVNWNEQEPPIASTVPAWQSASPVSVPKRSSTIVLIVTLWVVLRFSTRTVKVTLPPVSGTLVGLAVLVTTICGVSVMVTGSESDTGGTEVPNSSTALLISTRLVVVPGFNAVKLTVIVVDAPAANWPPSPAARSFQVRVPVVALTLSGPGTAL